MILLSSSNLERCLAASHDGLRVVMEDECYES